MGWQEAYLAFKNMYIHIKGEEEVFTNTRFLKEMLDEKWRGSVFPFWQQGKFNFVFIYPNNFPLWLFFYSYTSIL